MKLIDKDALVEEIEKRLEALANTSTDDNREFAAIIGAQHYELISLVQYINKLEVKEVDFELTWKDLALIEKIGNDFIKENDTPMDDKEFFEEVLKQFKERKEK